MSKLISKPVVGSATFPIDWIRSQFPALSKTVNDIPVAFLDGPGGTQVPQDRLERQLECHLPF